MKVNEIRPFSTYIGNGGVTRKVKSISMAIDGQLYVEWRQLKMPRQIASSNLQALEPIAKFADWAKALKDTMSGDLKHYLIDDDPLSCSKLEHDLETACVGLTRHR